MNNPNILIVNHKSKQCGLYQSGISLYNILRNSKRYNFILVECDSGQELLNEYKKYLPKAIIYNRNDYTMLWITRSLLRQMKVPHVCIMQTLSQSIADNLDNFLFDYYLTENPSILLNNPILFKYNRIIQKVAEASKETSLLPVVGSFGLCLPDKGFERVVYVVQSEFDEAIINLHMPRSSVIDPDGAIAEKVIKKCQDVVVKPGIQLNISCGFLGKKELVSFLSKNTINAFFYDEHRGLGHEVSGVMEYAIAANRPIALTRCAMFRHFLLEFPSICCIENNSLKEIIGRKPDYLDYFQNTWCDENLIWDFERIFDEILRRKINLVENVLKPVWEIKKRIARKLDRASKIFSEKNISKEEWYNELLINSRKNLKYIPVLADGPMNRILDNSAREFYKSTIAQIYEIARASTDRKIPESLVQYAFILDTVYKKIQKLQKSKILSVGCFGDSTVICLRQLGYAIEGIDPVLNYDLNSFMTRPSTKLRSYDIVFSTSFLGRVKEDEIFMNNMVKLLKPGGLGLITCDFNKSYEFGGLNLPDNYRFYTEADFLERIIPVLDGCELVGAHNWNYDKPDFSQAGFAYTLASLVFKKLA